MLRLPCRKPQCERFGLLEVCSVKGSWDWDSRRGLDYESSTAIAQ